MANFQLDSLVRLVSEFGFQFESSERTGFVFCDPTQDICLIIDTTICDLKDYPYIDYTTFQNALFHKFETVLRFLADDVTNPDHLKEEIRLFLHESNDIERLRRFGRNRSEQDIDPTLPEATFEDAFIEAFGESHRRSLQREFSHIDHEGKNRFVDYVLFTDSGKIAIELNGETYHHPCKIGPNKYRSQLFKQNSLSIDGFKVYRWSNNGMKDRENFIQELKLFFGESNTFKTRSFVKVKRAIETLQLYEHQEDALKYFQQGRDKGKSSFLLVLPTGTGKTEVFIKDIEQLKRSAPSLRALIAVPTRELRDQTIERFRERLPGLSEKVGTEIFDSSKTEITVQTYAFLHRHFYKLPNDRFDYIVIDEAHHSAADGLKRILEYYTPQHLIGVTATPDRFDQQKLENIFGEYESPLSLEDAIKKGLVPPIRCYRITSNIDLSEVRFNGKDYVKSDLQKTLHIPSRDEIIAETLKKFSVEEFARKQGVIFCVDIAHSKRMASCLNSYGFSALAVDGRDRKKANDALSRYKNGEVRFLCACDLLTEGWDAPQTSILVMARPTFSKVLYTQQIGRGLRNYPGKEALYIFDVVDNYGASLQPMSLHSLFGVDQYKPFEYIVETEKPSPQTEIEILDGLFEEIRRIEPINILNFENLYGDFFNEEQLARELFVSTGTVKTWVKNGKIKPDYSHPFGRSTLHFFNPKRLDSIIDALGLQKHTPETRKDDFFEFLRSADYTFSYKIIFLLAFLKLQNSRGEALLPELLDLYQAFYLRLLKKHLKNERENCPYNEEEFLLDLSSLKRNLLQNPFEKFERKRFFRHCKDLNYVAIDNELRKKLSDEDYEQITSQMIQDLDGYFKRQNISIAIEKEDYEFLTKSTDDRANHVEFSFIPRPAEEDKYSNVLPLFAVNVAAGDFFQDKAPEDTENWIDIRNVTSRAKLDRSMFVARIQGKSMEPSIPDGSYCLFSSNIGGSRNGKIVLARHSDIVDQDTGSSFTVKKYESEKAIDQDTGWRHENITLIPENPDYDEIHIPAEKADEFSIIAFFIEVLGGGPRRPAGL